MFLILLLSHDVYDGGRNEGQASVFFRESGPLIVHNIKTERNIMSPTYLLYVTPICL